MFSVICLNCQYLIDFFLILRKGGRPVQPGWFLPGHACPEQTSPAAATCAWGFPLLRVGVCGVHGSPPQVWGCRSPGTGCPHPLLPAAGRDGAVRWLGLCGAADTAGGCKSQRGGGKRPKEKRSASLKRGFVLAWAEASSVPPSLPPSLLFLSLREKNQFSSNLLLPPRSIPPPFPNIDK